MKKAMFRVQENNLYIMWVLLYKKNKNALTPNIQAYMIWLQVTNNKQDKGNLQFGEIITCITILLGLDLLGVSQVAQEYKLNKETCKS